MRVTINFQHKTPLKAIDKENCFKKLQETVQGMKERATTRRRFEDPKCFKENIKQKAVRKENLENQLPNDGSLQHSVERFQSKIDRNFGMMAKMLRKMERKIDGISRNVCQLKERTETQSESHEKSSQFDDEFSQLAQRCEKIDMLKKQSSQGSESSESNHGRMQQDRSQNCKIFVTNMDGGANERELEGQLRTLFQEHGKINSLVVRKSRNADYCFAFIEYGPEEDARNAVNALDQTIVGGKKIKVEFQDNAKRRKDSNKGCYTCGKMGHFARECNSVGNSGGGGRYRGRSRSRSYSRDSEPRRKHRKHHRSKYSYSSDRSRTPKRKRGKLKTIIDKKHRSRSRDRDDKKKRKHKKRHRESDD